jgi:DNA invertase Pin-like site-specific DNA recombinase
VQPRTATFTRESTKAQEERFGPDAQHALQARGIAAIGGIPTRHAWQIAHSGRTVDQTPQWAEMLAAARNREFDILVVAYVSRFARSVEVIARTVRQLHEAGVSVYFCDERLHTADPQAWDWWMREAVEAESHSRRMGRRIAEGHLARWERWNDPAGNASLGMFRDPDQDHRVMIGPDIAGAVRLFERYERETISYRRLANSEGLTEAAVREILQNPLYNGWAIRKGERRPSPWRNAPPVSDELWLAVQAKRASRASRDAPRTHQRDLALQGKITCAHCGHTYKHNGGNGSRRPQMLHRCPGAPAHAYYTDEVLAPLEAQVSQADISDATIEQVVRAMRAPTGDPAPPDYTLLRRNLARRHADGLLSDEAYLEQVRALRQAPRPAQRATPPAAAEIVAALRDVKLMWAVAEAKDRARILDATYAQATARAGVIESVALTADALNLGLDFALPESVDRARPAGIEPAT